MVETRKKLKGTNKIRQYIKYRNKNELFMSKNFNTVPVPSNTAVFFTWKSSFAVAGPRAWNSSLQFVTHLSPSRNIYLLSLYYPFKFFLTV